MPRQGRSSLVLIRYAISGKEQTNGVRLDLDKRVFIDQVDGGSQRKSAFVKAAPEIVSVLSTRLARPH
jgi:hypothetical protein